MRASASSVITDTLMSVWSQMDLSMLSILPTGHTPSGEVACWKDFKSDGGYLAIPMDLRVNVETGK